VPAQSGLLGARLATRHLKLEAADLTIRFTRLVARFGAALETQFAGFEQRFSAQEDG
jgi:hypothetical protein